MTDDHYFPPLDGLLSGNKYSVLLNAIKEHDDVVRVDYQEGDSEIDPSIFAELDTDETILDVEEPGAIQILRTHWWHLKGEKDWFKFEYVEMSMDFEGLMEDFDSPDDVHPEDIIEYIEGVFSARWNRQENDEVDGDDYLHIRTGEGDEDIIEEVDYHRDTPEAVSREILDQRIPGLVEEISS